MGQRDDPAWRWLLVSQLQRFGRSADWPRNTASKAPIMPGTRIHEVGIVP